VSEVNACFKPFKDVHKGKSAAVIGCGPSLSEYDGSKNIIHIGCNEMIYSPELTLDYHFVGDAQVGWPNRDKTFYKDPEAYNNYRPRIQKFIRDHPSSECSVLNVTGGVPVKHAIHYDVCPPWFNNSRFVGERQQQFQKDIVNNYMYSRMSISWEMMQFALWTGVEKIYLIGHDCSYAKGSIHNPHIRNYDGKPRQPLIDKWKDMKLWISEKYPNVKVMSINPDAMTHFDEVLIDDIVEN